MTSFTWAGAASAAWTSPIFWSVDGATTSQWPGSLNGNADSASIAAGTATVASSAYPDIVNLAVSAGALLLVAAGLAVEGTFANAGRISIDPGGVMTTGNLGEPAFGAFSNTGVIDVAQGASFSLFAPTTTAALGSFAPDSGRIVLANALDNTGAIIAASAYANIDLSGTVHGGIVRNDSASMHIVNRVPQGDGYPPAVTFNAVTFQGVLAPLGPLAITGGFALQPLAGSANTIDLTGTATVPGLPPLHAAIIALDAETLDNVTILLGALQSAATLTLGANAKLSNAGIGFLGGRGAFLSSATITNSGVLAINNAGSFVNSGLLTNAGGTITDDNGGSLINSGTILLQGGQFTAPVTGTGVLELAAGATADLTVDSGLQLFRFLDNTSLLRLDHVGGSSEVLGFLPGDAIELVNTPASIAFASGTLSVSNGGLTIASFLMPDQPGNAQFHASTDANADTVITTGTFITETIPCFASGTTLATPQGEVRVEHLRPGQHVLLAGGGTAPVAWIGHRSVACRRHRRPWDVQPVRVHAHAFAPGQPAADLLLSPDHAVLWQGILVPIRALTNGRTIMQENVETITYWHVELPRHDVILAQGLPCESFLDTGNRAAFANGPVVELHPDFTPGVTAAGIWSARGYAALVQRGPRLAALRRHLLLRAMRLGNWITDNPDLRLRAGRRALDPDIDGAAWHVALPPRTKTLRLLSRVWVPAQSRINEPDSRSLGVAIANIRFDNEAITLDDPRLGAGWHAPEADWRWTAGDATLAVRGVRELRFDIGMTGSYWQAPLGTAAGAAGKGASHVRH